MTIERAVVISILVILFLIVLFVMLHVLRTSGAL